MSDDANFVPVATTVHATASTGPATSHWTIAVDGAPTTKSTAGYSTVHASSV